MELFAESDECHQLLLAGVAVSSPQTVTRSSGPIASFTVVSGGLAQDARDDPLRFEKLVV
jgi:hypothetical protein